MIEDIILTEQEKLYWEKIFNTEFIFEKGCYSTCSSHCCKWDTPDLPLTIIPKGGTLFYLPKEYAYISKYGKITEIPPYKMKTKLFDKELFIYYKHCNDDANCNIKFSRSLYCKLYPFIPVFDIEGNLLDLKFISIYDVTYDFIGQKSPCYVKDLKAKYIDLWSKEDSNIHLLKNPYTLFYLMVGNLIHDNYVETLKSNNKLINLQGKEFWKKWEKLYLAGRLINKNKLEKGIEKLYNDFSIKYNFSLED